MIPYCTDQYGILYDWKTATTVCPTGWHLPSHNEWNDLGKAVGCKKQVSYGTARWYGANMVLKAKSGWNSDERRNGNGNDDYGFSALPGGSVRCVADSKFRSSHISDTDWVDNKKLPLTKEK